MNGKYLPLLWIVSIVLLLSMAQARVAFLVEPFEASEFRNAQRLEEACAAPAASSFWCRHLGEELTLITTKGADLIFNQAGEVMAVFAKEQNGLDFRRNYAIDQNQNLIPYRAAIPGGALLVDGNYQPPEAPTGAWERRSETEVVGVFRYRVGELEVEKTVVVSYISHVFDVRLVVTRAEGAERDTPIQYAFPGIGRQDRPVIKVGQGENYTLNPLSQPIPAPAYISLQSNNRNSGFAIVMRPHGQPPGLAALPLPPDRIALQRTLATDEGSEVVFDLGVYAAPNELVRFYQESYRELPGLFYPNLLGRLSIWILAVLMAIHDVVGNWGLSIIALTLLFRALIWPLITTQTKSMVGMQQLQPKLQALQKKYKDNREKLTQETMKLYKEAGVNPAGGCLPIFAQMPLFIILWRIFSNFEFNEGFLWIPDLGLPDPTFILPILYVGVMMASAFLIAKGNPQSLRLQIMINLVFVFFIIQFPAGVTLYWVVSMLVQVLQHYLIQRNYPAPATAS